MRTVIMESQRDVVFTPLMLLYQGWTYYVFRKRLGGNGAAASYGSLGADKR